MKKVNKKLAGAIVLGLMMAVPFSASAAETVTIDTEGKPLSQEQIADLNGKNVIFTNTAKSGQIFASTTNGKEITVDGVKNIHLDGVWSNNAFYASNGGTLVVNANELKTVNKDFQDYNVIQVWSGKGEFNFNNVEIKNVYNALYAQRTGAPNTEDSNLIFKATGDIVLEANQVINASSFATENLENKTSVEVEGNNVTLETIEGDYKDYAIRSINARYDNSDGSKSYDPTYASNTSVNVTAKENLNIYAQDDEYGAILACNGLEEKSASVTLAAKNIHLEGDIWADTNAYVKIGGNDNFNKADIISDITAIDSDVDIYLGNGGSFTGSITTSGESLVKPAETVELVENSTGSSSNVSINMGTGSVWNVTGDSIVSAITGEGTVALAVEGNVNDGYTAKTVTGNTDGADLTLTAMDKDAGNVKDLDEAKAIFDALKTGMSNANDGVTGMEIKETITSGAITADKNGGNVQQAKYSTTEANMRDIASVALVAWRQEDSTLSQRLGELRNSEGDQGIWARMSRGEFEYSGAFKNQYNYFQMGYDWAAEDWHYGAAISHNDGQTTYANGNGENDSTSLTLYGTWLGDKGQYTDIVVKHGKLNNEFTNYAEAGVTTGDYDMWGTSISAEYGQKLEMNNDWYVIPQAQLTYMVIGSEDYTATVTKDGVSSPMQVSQDSMDSVVGRVGFEAGKHISDKGSIYAKASLLHEFAGEADTTLLYGDNTGNYSQDLGDTWYECGIGVNYKTSDNSYVYADVVKTFGGDVETPWQWNAGMRFTF